MPSKYIVGYLTERPPWVAVCQYLPALREPLECSVPKWAVLCRLTKPTLGHSGQREREMKSRTGVFSAVLVGTMMIAGVAVAGGHLQPSNTDAQNVYWFADGTYTGGDSFLTRTDGMVLASVEAAGLNPGDAYTVWWIVFNNPAGCSAPCGENDIFTPEGDLNAEGVIAAQIGVGNATGNVAKSDGTAEFGARLKRNDGDASGHQILFPAGLAGDSVLTASGDDAEIHLVFQSHGQARGGPQLMSQLTYVETGCTPFCEDIQFSVHLP